MSGNVVTIQLDGSLAEAFRIMKERKDSSSAGNGSDKAGEIVPVCLNHAHLPATSLVFCELITFWQKPKSRIFCLKNKNC